MKLSDIKFPFTVIRITSTQDANGDTIEVDTGFSTKCALKKISTKQALYAGIDTTVERAEIIYYRAPDRDIRNGDHITLRGETWVPEGFCTQVDEGRFSYYKQLLKRG